MIINSGDIYGQGAAAIAAEVRRLLTVQPRINFALPGGRSIKGLLHALRSIDMPWDAVEFFMVDERLVALDDPQSNFRLLDEELFSYLVAHKHIEKRQLHPFHYDPRSEDKGIGAYAQELQKYGGSYDIIVLGVGEDGHIGALAPHHHSVRDPSGSFIWMKDSPKPPALRMSTSRSLLARSKVAFALFIGEAKREAYMHFQDDKLSVEACPVKIITALPRSYIITDVKV